MVILFRQSCLATRNLAQRTDADFEFSKDWAAFEVLNVSKAIHSSCPVSLTVRPDW